MTEQRVVALWELIQTSHVVERRFREVFATEGLSPTQYGVLASLADGDGFTKAELARAILVRPQTIDPIIESMLGRGLIERDGEPRRGKRTGVRITDAGRAVMLAVRPRVAALNHSDSTGLDPDATRQLVDALRTIRRNLSGESGR